VELTRAKATIHNVAGWLEGKGKLKDQVIVIGAHYDHLGHGGPGAIGKAAPDAIYHGADDNASGTAGVVLLARRFAALARDRDADRRSLLFVCFSGEERGLLGSQHMLAHIGELGIKHEQMVAMFNFDMIGRMKEDKVIVVGTGSGDLFEKLMKDAAAVTDVKAVSGGAVGGSDHQSFHARKIPAVHFYTGVHPDYHKPSDTADKVNHEGGVKTVELAARMILPLWASDSKVAWQTVRMAHPAAGGPTGSGAYLGVIPRYADLDANDGAAIDGASPGSPAEAAGLKSDDVIVGWNDKSVKNLQELTDRLRESKPGQEIALKVKRGGMDVVIKVKLGTR
jgi:Zn-dependent M28 family amino/carboxypeptidase